MSKISSIVAIFSEFITRYPWHFGILFLLLVIESVIAALSIVALMPLADFMLDPALIKPSRVTQVVIGGLDIIELHSAFWLFSALFVVLNFLRSLLEVVIHYAVLRIKYAVLRGFLVMHYKLSLSPDGSFLAVRNKASLGLGSWNYPCFNLPC